MPHIWRGCQTSALLFREESSRLRVMCRGVDEQSQGFLGKREKSGEAAKRKGIDQVAHMRPSTYSVHVWSILLLIVQIKRKQSLATQTQR